MANPTSCRITQVTTIPISIPADDSKIKTQLTSRTFSSLLALCLHLKNKQKEKLAAHPLFPQLSLLNIPHPLFTPPFLITCPKSSARYLGTQVKPVGVACRLTTARSAVNLSATSIGQLKRLNEVLIYSAGVCRDTFGNSVPLLQHSGLVRAIVTPCSKQINERLRTGTFEWAI
ncbi:hypothetical protein CDAR_585791 [Caerostris darwini]|uniref:Ribosomal protein S8 n=1 Tax=Caerostris darwini TaxID=1538125 RepID=A0AAV4TN63_9ARAC|nr:hypothetical protein CDAR_585791 [Caerostris darwini]